MLDFIQLFNRNHLGGLIENEKSDRAYSVNTMTQRFKSKYATIKFYTTNPNSKI